MIDATAVFLKYDEKYIRDKPIVSKLFCYLDYYLFFFTAIIVKFIFHTNQNIHYYWYQLSNNNQLNVF